MIACLINGQALSSIAITDRAIHYGDGLFETIALKHGVMPFWCDHYQRLLFGCERLKLPKINEGLLLQEIDAVKQNQEHVLIKIIITRGTGERGYKIPSVSSVKRIVQAFAYPEFPALYYEQGIKVVFCKTPVSENKYLAGIKHINRLDNVLASSEWQDNTIAEGLMSTQQQQIIQGTKSNIFYVHEGEFYTPDLTSAGISGIMRAQILAFAQLHHIKVNIKAITRDDLFAADEIFLCNSIFGIWPVTDLEGRMFPIGNYTKKLLNYFN